MKIADELIQKYFDVHPNRIGYCTESNVTTILLLPKQSLLKDEIRILINISLQRYLVRVDKYLSIKGIWEPDLVLVNKYWHSVALSEEDRLRIVHNELSSILEAFISFLAPGKESNSEEVSNIDA